MSLICPDCGRNAKDSPSHFIPKCKLQHTVRNLCLVAHRAVVKMAQFVDEDCCVCEPANLGEVRVKEKSDE